MSTVILPNRYDGTQRYKFRVNLAGSLYQFEFFWNARDQSWSFTLSDLAGNALLSKKVVLNTPLTYRYSRQILNGDLFAYDTSGANVEPGLTDLGSRVLLTFTDAADLP